MSYDLHLFQPTPGLDPLVEFRQIMEEEEQEVASSGQMIKPPAPGAIRQRLQELADVLKSRFPEFHQSPQRSRPWVELTHDRLGIQIIITQRVIDLGMPYFRKEAGDLMNVVAGCIDGLQKEGYAAYDPQLDRIVGPSDFPAMVAQYRSTDAVLPHILKDAGARKKPWWKFW